jgi:hypothetical protein
VVFRIEGTSAAKALPARSATFTLEMVSSPISRAADWLLSASLRTSLATTANPRPCSPARAALSVRARQSNPNCTYGYVMQRGWPQVAQRNRRSL